MLLSISIRATEDLNIGTSHSIDRDTEVPLDSAFYYDPESDESISDASLSDVSMSNDPDYQPGLDQPYDWEQPNQGKV